MYILYTTYKAALLHFIDQKEMLQFGNVAINVVSNVFAEHPAGWSAARDWSSEIRRRKDAVQDDSIDIFQLDVSASPRTEDHQHHQTEAS